MLGNVSVSVTLTKGVLGHDIFLCVLGFYSTYFFFARELSSLFPVSANVIQFNLSRLLALLHCFELL